MPLVLSGLMIYGLINSTLPVDSIQHGLLGEVLLVVFGDFGYSGKLNPVFFSDVGYRLPRTDARNPFTAIYREKWLTKYDFEAEPCFQILFKILRGMFLNNWVHLSGWFALHSYLKPQKNVRGVLGRLVCVNGCQFKFVPELNGAIIVAWYCCLSGIAKWNMQHRIFQIMHKDGGYIFCISLGHFPPSFFHRFIFRLHR